MLNWFAVSMMMPKSYASMMMRGSLCNTLGLRKN